MREPIKSSEFATKSMIKRTTSLYAQAFSCNRDEPTASSVLDQGEFDMISPAGLGPCGKAEVDEVDRWLLREKDAQLPALPART